MAAWNTNYNYPSTAYNSANGEFGTDRYYGSSTSTQMDSSFCPYPSGVPGSYAPNFPAPQTGFENNPPTSHPSTSSAIGFSPLGFSKPLPMPQGVDASPLNPAGGLGFEPFQKVLVENRGDVHPMPQWDWGPNVSWWKQSLLSKLVLLIREIGSGEWLY